MTSRDFNSKDGGWTQVMNEFIKALCSYGLDSNEWRLVMLIIQYSWGMDGKAWAILRWQFIKEKTGLPQASLIYARRKLIARNFIHTRKDGQQTEYKINSKYETWIPEGKIPAFRKYYQPVLGHSSDLNNIGHSSDLNQVTPVTQLGHLVDLTSSRKKDLKKEIKKPPISPIEKPHVLTKKEIIEQDAKTVIDYMNDISGKEFKYSETSLSKVRARLREGFTLDQCLMVCFNKWHDKDHKEKYYRPGTLFRPSLFEGYANEKGTKQKPQMSEKFRSTYEMFKRRYHEREQDPPGGD